MSKLILSVGELLWDLLPGRAILGGAPSNLAFRLVEMGNDSRIVSRVGTDELGDRALSAVSSLGLSTEFIQRDMIHRTGTVDVTFDADKNPEYVINPNVAYDFIEPTPGLVEAASRCRCLVYGTLAQRTQVTRETISQLIDHSLNAIKFLDINLRKDCYSFAVVDASLRSADVLKTNHHEIRELKEMVGLGASDLAGIMEDLAAIYGIWTIVVTLEESGVLLHDSEQGKYYLPGYSVSLEDPLGAGDAFSAAFINHMLNGSTLIEACIRGNMLGAAVATTKGGTQPVNEEYIRSVIREDQLHIIESLKEYIPEDFTNKNQKK